MPLRGLGSGDWAPGTGLRGLEGALHPRPARLLRAHALWLGPFAQLPSPRCLRLRPLGRPPSVPLTLGPL